MIGMTVTLQERSTIDHFFWSDNIVELIIENMSKHEGDNLSDHSPVILKLKFPHGNFAMNSEAPRPPKQLWNEATKASIENYKDCLDRKSVV